MFHKIQRHLVNIGIVFAGTVLALVVISLRVGSPGLILGRFAFVGFVLLVLAYKFRVPGVPSFGHTILAGTSLLTLIVAAGIIDHNFWLVTLGVCSALLAGWILLNARYRRVREIFYPGEWPDDDGSR